MVASKRQRRVLGDIAIPDISDDGAERKRLNVLAQHRYREISSFVLSLFIFPVAKGKSQEKKAGAFGRLLEAQIEQSDSSRNDCSAQSASADDPGFASPELPFVAEEHELGDTSLPSPGTLFLPQEAPPDSLSTDTSFSESTFLSPPDIQDFFSLASKSPSSGFGS